MEATLTITLDAAGKVGIAGTIPSAVVALGMLEVAKVLVLKHPEPQRSPILRAVPALVPSPLDGR